MDRRLTGAMLVISLLFGTLVSVSGAAGAKTTEVVKTRNLKIPVKSGGFLRGDLYQPAVDGEPTRTALPTIVTYFPYSKDDTSRFETDAMTRFAQQGFAGLLVDIRGTGNSPGEYGLLSKREIKDGYDVVEWAARQRWSDGHVGMWGYSYPGLTAAMVSTLHPPHLDAIVPGSIFSDGYRDLFYPGGIRASQDSVLMPWLAVQAMGRAKQDTSPEDAVANMADAVVNARGALAGFEIARHPFFDRFWQSRSVRAEEIEVPALFWSGWRDVYPRGSTLAYLEAGSQHKGLVLGPWGHIGGASGEPFEFFLRESLAWFEIFLRGEEASQRLWKQAQVPAVRLFDVDPSDSQTYEGWPGRWRAFSGVPFGNKQALELCTADESLSPSTPWGVRGKLDGACNDKGEVPIVPAPIEATGGVSVLHGTVGREVDEPRDQRANPGATAFVGSPRKHPVTITGSMRVQLWAKSEGNDADWSVRIVDIGPDATTLVARGWLRASHRQQGKDRHGFVWHKHNREVPVEPGKPYRLEIELWPTSYRIPAGHQLGVLVQAADTAKVASSNSPMSWILVGKRHPSRVFLKVRTQKGIPFVPIPSSG